MTETDMDLFERRSGASGTREEWRQRLEVFGRLREALRAGLDATDARERLVGMLGYDLDRARIAVALGERSLAQDALACAAAEGAAALLALARAEGAVVLTLPGAAPARIALREPLPAKAITPPVWMDALCAAWLVHDDGALTTLAHGPSVAVLLQAAQRLRPAIGAEQYWAPYCSAWVALLRGEDASAFLRTTQAGLSAQPGSVDPAYLTAVERPLIAAMTSLAARDAHAWHQRMEAALRSWEAYYAQADNAQLVPGLAPLGLAGLAALGARAGLPAALDPDLVPQWLLQLAASPVQASIEYQFAPRQARDAREIGWLLDLEGVPRVGRSHTLHDEAGSAVARYRLSGWTTAPIASASFTLDPNAAPLLDAGELLAVADLHAEAVAGEPEAEAGALAVQRFHLAEAAACMDAILEQIPPDAQALPEAAFTSARGRALHDAEPGRFEPLRLRAVRDAYCELLARVDARLRAESPRESPVSEEAARAMALASAGAIELAVRPLLEALARDDSGEIVARLRPRPDDYEKAFRADAVDVARAHYQALRYDASELRRSAPEPSQLRVFVAPAGMLGEDNELSRHFPGGYRNAAPWLDPHRVWVCWKYLRAGASSGVSFDGLVWCDDHWAWFPRPYRVLAALAPGSGR
jgi:hypothetical protein